MKHLALILLTSSLFTACMTDSDKVMWSETKMAFSSDGNLFSTAVAEMKGQPVEAGTLAEKAQSAPASEQKPVEATTGR